MRRTLALILGLTCLSPLHAQATDTITVYAAASLTNALNDIAKDYQASHDVQVKASYASSGTLAKQIDAGAPAEVFASADTQWMDFLQNHHRLDDSSRRDLLANALVVIAPKAHPFKAELQAGTNFPASFSGKLCTGEPTSVPVGLYAREALTKLGWWDALQGRIVGTEDVRSALAFVERGECPAGIVYQTDALISDKVVIVARFPDDSHKPVVYPFALTTSAGAAAKAYFRYLSGPQAKAVFEKYGFTIKSAP